MRWDWVERRKITWSELWNKESNMLSFTFRATYDVLPSPTILHLWYGEDPACLQCLAPATLKHILVGCKTSLTQGRYTWRHNQVLKCLAATLESKRVTVNAMPLEAQTTLWQPTSFVREGEKRSTNLSKPLDSCPLNAARDWEMQCRPKKHFTPSLHLDEKQLLAADVKICLLIPAVRTDPSVSPESERPDMVELIQLEEKNPFKCAYCT
ncbi:hypothetical protein F2P81_002431 [Scophthalmus maximus]|uniref:Reverse transcriptase zinc-binding domain-containing protein n=1 Tax=Scophthalmus maximus TaxID=52904 RepID=A0A6A4TV62_SCOMX|nr:hypothetical protein F2P81_002431 [Scophthalmus maximus]